MIVNNHCSRSHVPETDDGGGTDNGEEEMDDMHNTRKGACRYHDMIKREMKHTSGELIKLIHLVYVDLFNNRVVR